MRLPEIFRASIFGAPSERHASRNGRLEHFQEKLALAEAAVESRFPCENATMQTEHFQEKWNPVFRAKMRQCKRSIFRKSGIRFSVRKCDNAKMIGEEMGAAT
jgi:hypothetical protein